MTEPYRGDEFADDRDVETPAEEVTHTQAEDPGAAAGWQPPADLLPPAADIESEPTLPTEDTARLASAGVDAEAEDAAETAEPTFEPAEPAFEPAEPAFESTESAFAPTFGAPSPSMPPYTPPSPAWPSESSPVSPAEPIVEATRPLVTEPPAPPSYRPFESLGEPTPISPEEPAAASSPASPEEQAPEPVAEPSVAEPVVEATRSIVPESTPPAVAVAPTESIFRAPSPQSPEPRPESSPTEELSEEEQKLAAERAARREARAAALAATTPAPAAIPEPVIILTRSTDKFWGAVGLFLLRLVVAAIFAIRGLGILTDIPAAGELFAKTIIPEPQIMAIVTGVASLLIALSMVLGLLTRVSGLGVTLIAAGALAFVYWGNWSPFVAGQPGFLGELELLLAAVGLLFLTVGGGGWSLDRSFRAGRERDRRGQPVSLG